MLHFCTEVFLPVFSGMVLTSFDLTYRSYISFISVSHGVRCGVCRTYPIVGLRYRCLRCLGYDQCQSCFFHGRLSKRHKLKHPMQEYCWEVCTVVYDNV